MPSARNLILGMNGQVTILSYSRQTAICLMAMYTRLSVVDCAIQQLTVSEKFTLLQLMMLTQNWFRVQQIVIVRNSLKQSGSQCRLPQVEHTHQSRRSSAGKLESTMNNQCPHCGQALKDDGEQRDDIRRVVYSLGTCINPSCAVPLSTHAYGERTMTDAENRKADEVMERIRAWRKR